MITDASWIGCPAGTDELCPAFTRFFHTQKNVKRAKLSVSVIGVYDAYINGERIGNFILAPGCTSYSTRLQYQTYDITDMLSENNTLTITVGPGWHRGRISENIPRIHDMPCALIAELTLESDDGITQILTDEKWNVETSRVRYSDIYNGEIYDANAEINQLGSAVVLSDLNKSNIIPQEGEVICEHERIAPVECFTTPKGERVIDFGQNIAGYVELDVFAQAGEKIHISHAEVLDGEGNFYKANYRSAKAEFAYICRNGRQTYKPSLTFFGFRYIRLDECPENIGADNFTAIAVYSDIKRTGYINTSHAGINRLVSNTIWSQRGNFIDIPTDCPQRDERRGWLGDAQVFAKTAGYNYNVKKFFEKWMRDICAEQHANGAVRDTAPDLWRPRPASTAWGDAITIIPWQMYLLYGDKKILVECFDAMKGWLRYIGSNTAEPYLWIRREDDNEQKHYGDWLALDAPAGSFRGSTDEEFIASAFYAYSTSLVIKTGKAIGKDISKYESLYENIKTAFKKRYNTYKTQTEHVLALVFDLTDNKTGTAKALADMIRANGNKLKTGFVGTPYLLHALSENGFADIAYDLLLQEEYPSWLYEVNRGATSIWEHWDGIRCDGTFLNVGMNSYNHYAYGSVIDWIYTVAAGIKADSEYPGFERVIIAPTPSKRLEWVDVSYDTPHGRVTSKWSHWEKGTRYEITSPSPAKIIIGGKTHNVDAGSYVFFGE